MTNQSNTPQPVLTDAEIMRSAINASGSLNITRFHEMGAPSRTIMDDAGLLELGRAIETAVLSKLRAPVADERISLRGAANLAFNALHECKPVKGAEKQYSDAIQALQSALHDIAYTVNRTATPQQFADHLQREDRAALASAPVAGHQPYPALPEPDVTHPGEQEDSYSRSAMAAAMRAAHDRGYSVGWDHGKEHASAPVAGEAQPVAWVAADTLNSPHPKSISSLAYMSQIDQDRGREYVPLYAAPVAAQAPSGPEGWVMVPVQPTEVMKAAGCRALGAIYGHYGAEQCWKAMLDAAMQRTSGGDHA